MPWLQLPLPTAALATAGALICWLILAIWHPPTIGQQDVPFTGIAGAAAVTVPQTTVISSDTSTGITVTDLAAVSASISELAAEPLNGEPPLADRMQDEVSRLTKSQTRLAEEVLELRQQLVSTSASVPDVAAVEKLTAEWTAAVKRLEQQDQDLLASVAGMQQHLEQWQAEAIARKAAAEAAPAGPLVSKLYQPLTVSAGKLEPLIAPLLSPGVGFAGSVPSRNGSVDVILFRDRQEVLDQVDRLLIELDRPLPGLEIDIAAQEIDRETGTPQSLAVPLSPQQIERDGPSLIVPEPEPTGQRSAGEPQAAPDTRRVLRITPRLVH